MNVRLLTDHTLIVTKELVKQAEELMREGI